MSSRALRKLQREQEEQQRLAAAQAAESQIREDSEEELQPTKAPPPRNAFDMLEEAQDEESEDEVQGVATPATDSTQPETPSSIPKPSSAFKSKKKKKKPRKKLKEAPDKPEKPASDSDDEVDRAIKALALKSKAHKGEGPSKPIPVRDWETDATRLLSVETKNLNPINEMKSLFGNVAVEEHEARSSRNPRQREVNEQGGMDLGTALLGRNNVASRRKELGALANRRNCLMRGREEWPLAPSGGLSMENVRDNETFGNVYNILHNGTYQGAQMNFRMAVESMDPQRMMSLLLMTPYHIASLLQVAEIARHQGDHSVSGDLLERALYSFGKSVHSSFPASMREGTARVPFDKAANRELYLTIWRYIRNLEMRGTFKTAFEWSKLLLQLNTRSDPYGATLMIDQLALRGRCHDQLIALAAPDAYGQAWDHLPNIKISLVLALMRSKKPKEARQQLAVAMTQYPYILSALASALDISPLPKSLWAKLPSTDAEKLYTELYVSRAKDLWNTPETSALLVEVAETLPHYSAVTNTVAQPAKLEISLEEARHIILLESPQLLGLLPRNFTRMATTGYDPLPPPSSNEDSDFTARAPTDASGPSAIGNIINGAGAGGLTMLNRIVQWFTSPANATGDPGQDREGEEALRELRQQLGPDIPEEVFQQLLQAQLGHGDTDDEQEHFIDPEGLGLGPQTVPAGTPGGWDYYVERDDAQTDDEDDEIESEDMPELEDIPTAETRPTAAPTPPPIQPARNPRAAMVEEEADEDANPARSAALNDTRAVLRHVDSDDEGTLHAPAPRAQPPLPIPALRAQQQQQQQQHQQQQPAELPGSSTTTTGPSDQDIERDTQRLQRWLLTSGLVGLGEKESGSAEMQLYVRRLRMLQARQRDWVLSVVGQRGSEEKGVVERVRAML
jgi:hypothetical protein